MKAATQENDRGTAKYCVCFLITVGRFLECIAHLENLEQLFNDAHK